jgi:hypothetical protein
MAERVDILRTEECPCSDSVGHMAPVMVLRKVPFDLMGGQVVDKRERRPRSYCGRREASVLRVPRHSRYAVAAVQDDTSASPRTPGPSPRFLVIQAQAREVYIRPVLGLVSVIEAVVGYEPAMSWQGVVGVVANEIRTRNRRGGCRREFRLGMTS